MILCLKIGNSHIFGGIFSEEKLVCKFRHASDEKITSDQLGLFFLTFLQAHAITPNSIKKIGYCSVVPSLEYTVRAAFIKYFSLTPFILQPGMKTGIKIKSKAPHEVGSDRIANAVAATHTFPNRNIIVIDFSTATTVDFISNQAEYLGGAILPGLRISMTALQTRTAKLNPVNIEKPKHTVGQTTAANIQTGLYYGQLGAIREIIIRGQQECFPQQEPLIVATGGFAHLYAEENLYSLNLPTLSLQGIRLSLLRNQPLAKIE